MKPKSILGIPTVHPNLHFILFSDLKFSFDLLCGSQIQRKLQLRIEEQGKQLKMMFDQQQKTSSSGDLLNTQNLGNNDKPISPKDVEVFISEGCGNSLFPSKIS